MLGLFKKNWILLTILLLGAFLRLYRISDYMTFLGDEGRDVIIVRNLLVHFDPILIGPGTSVGGMYLGPLYYYFMAPFLLLWGFSPVGPAIGVALLGIATIYLTYQIGKEWFGKIAGIVAALFFAISPTVINYSHSSWNPNIMPFFVLLAIYSVWKVFSLKKYSWLIVTAVSFAFVMQSHYLGVLIAPVLLIYWFLSKVPRKITLISLGVFLFLMSPLLIFDIRHDWMNSKALYKFLTVRDETVSINPLSATPKSYPIFEQINTSLLTAKQVVSGKVVSVIFTIFILVYIFILRKRNFDATNLAGIQNTPYNILLLWLAFGLIGFGIYKQPVYDHYFGFLFPIPFLLLGSLVGKIWESKKLFYQGFMLLALIYLILINLNNNPFKKEPNRLLARSERVSAKVLEIADGKPFNLAVLAERNYEDGYRYFMEVAGAKVLHADRWDKNTISDTLIVICEKQKEKCDPTHSPKAEVANFGWSKIESDWEVDGVYIFKLIHSK